LTKQTWQARWAGHVSQALSRKSGWGHFQNSIRKYGKDAFEHYEFSIKFSTLEEANAAEELAIEFLCTRDPKFGFNITKGGLHVPHPVKADYWKDPEFRARMAAKAKARWKDPVIRARNIAATKASLNTPESKAKRILSSKEVLARPEVKAKLSAAAKGRIFTEEHREKLSAANLARSPEMITSIGAKGVGRLVTPKTREKISEKNRLRRHSEDSKKKIGAHNIGRALSLNAITTSVARRRERAAAKTHFHCKVHGPILLKKCFKRKNGNSKFPRYECKICKLTQKARKDQHVSESVRP
jgi:hypothetical protein